jgi:RNA-directed DNA polymerase
MVIIMEINNLLNLSDRIGIKWLVLSEMLNNIDKEYKKAFISKKKGGKRFLSIPSDRLRYCQEFILRQILEHREVNDCAHGFVNDKTIFTNAKQHIISSYCINIDIENFFGSTTWKQVYYVFNTVFGFNKSVSIALTTLTTFENGLPQGACTSPYISNIVCENLDERILKYSLKNNYTYTRYADDITISSGEVMDFSKVLFVTQNIIESCGYKVNFSKTKKFTKTNNIQITGLVIVDGVIKVPRKYIKKIKQELYFIKKFGVVNHIQKMEIENMYYKEHLLGKINYLKNIDEEQYKKFIIEYDKIEWPEEYYKLNFKIWKL